MISSVVCRFFFMFRFWGLAPKPNILNGPILGGHLIGIGSFCMTAVCLGFAVSTNDEKM